MHCNGELYTCLKKIMHVSITLISNTVLLKQQKLYITVDSPAHKKYKNLCLMSVE